MKILLTLLILMTNYIFAYDGYVTALQGNAYIIRDSQSIKANIGFYIHKNDVIKTSDNTRLQIVFKDHTVISLGKNSTFSVEDYFYDEQTPEKTNAIFKFSQGIFKSITGKIGKINPKKFKLKTKSATIGIRGTIFFGEITDNNSEDIACTSGKITVETPKGVISIPAGKISSVEVGKAPSKPTTIPKEKLLYLEKTSGALENEKESNIGKKQVEQFKIGYLHLPNINSTLPASEPEFKSQSNYLEDSNKIQ